MSRVDDFQHKALYSAAYSYQVDEFEKYLSDVETLSDSAYRRLTEIGVEAWARSKCAARRYGFMTSNAAEVFNGAIKWPRRLPVCVMLEAIRAMIERTFDEKRRKANERQNYHELTEETLLTLSSQDELSRYFTVREVSSNTLYRVQEEDRSYLLEIDYPGCVRSIARTSEHSQSTSESVAPFT